VLDWLHFPGPTRNKDALAKDDRALPLFPSDALTGWVFPKPICFECTGFGVLKYILRLPNGSTLYVKERF
jgi:hypothetical protein